MEYYVGLDVSLKLIAICIVDRTGKIELKHRDRLRIGRNYSFAYLERLRPLQIKRVEPFCEPSVNRGKQFARLLQLTLVALKTREAHCGAKFPAPVTISDNTNSNAATNGQSLHRRRHWFAAKNPSWRSQTRHGTPPKEAAAGRAIHQKMQIRAVWSRRASVNPVELLLWNMLMARTNSPRVRVVGLTPQTPPATPSPPSDRACRSLP
jgi:hypothetical protein